MSIVRGMPMDEKELAVALDSFSPDVRRKALSGIIEAEGMPTAVVPEANLHAHTFFSYNPYGYSPSHYAWLARKRGLMVAGIVEFDVLDGLDEFRAAGRTLGLKTCVGIESRVFVSEFGDQEINSPGEPGIAYHMGVGFTTTALEKGAAKFLEGMRNSAEQRNRALTSRVNAHTSPIELDYDKDVIPLTPKGNAIERHICLAYASKAAAHFSNDKDLAAFWSDKLGGSVADLDLPDGPKLQALIRSKTMKQGGVGYVQPDSGSYPKMADMNRFSLAAGAIPTMTWLSGTSPAEQAIEQLMAAGMASGTAALNVIPDRNFTPGVKDEKLQNLYDVVALAEEKGLPVVAGTEMNSPGSKLVDDFESAELKPVVPAFLRGAHIVYAHTVLQEKGGMGYLSEWAEGSFKDVFEKNILFEKLGRAIDPLREDHLGEADSAMSPDQVLALAHRGT